MFFVIFLIPGFRRIFGGALIIEQHIKYYITNIAGSSNLACRNAVFIRTTCFSWKISCSELSLQVKLIKLEAKDYINALYVFIFFIFFLTGCYFHLRINKEQSVWQYLFLNNPYIVILPMFFSIHVKFQTNWTKGKVYSKKCFHFSVI